MEVRAVSIGPAASLALFSGAATLRLHSVFSSTVNLEDPGTRRFVSLCGPGTAGLPHAVVLEPPADLGTWRLVAGLPARLADGRIHLSADPGTVVVDLNHAERTPPRTLPSIARCGDAHRACELGLAELQKPKRCDLRMDGLRRAGGASTALGTSLCNAALALGAASHDLASGDGRATASLGQAVAALVGLGHGLTPSGDDFLCGFLAAARGACPRLADALQDAAENNLDRTGVISAFLVRCAIEGFWPMPLVELARALAREDEAASLVALGELCTLGHSSGCDIATGFLFGLESLAARSE